MISPKIDRKIAEQTKTDPSDLDSSMNIQNLGLSSIQQVELKALSDDIAGREIELEFYFSNPTLLALTDQILQK